MSTSTQPTDFSDLYSSLLEKARENATTALVTVAKQYIQQAHMDLYLGNYEKFHWAERRGYITTHEEYSTGTVAATQGSATLAGTSTLWTTSNDQGQQNVRAGGKMCIDGTDTVYEVTAVGGAGTATISPAYIGSTDTGLSYRYFEDSYALASDFWKPVDARSFDDNSNIRLIGRTELRRMFPRNHITNSSIRCATLVDEAPSGNTTEIRRIVFAPPPNNTQVIPYSYITANIVTSSTGTAQTAFSATTDEPIMPLRYRHVIVHKALAEWFRIRKDDTERGALEDAIAQRTLDTIIGDQDVGAPKMRVTFNRGQYRMRAKSPWGARGGRYDVNGRFDRFED